MKMKKLISFCTAMTLLAGSLSVLPVSAEESKLPGDVDISGEVNVADAVLLARYNAEDKEITVTAQGLLNADLTGDDKVNSDDSSVLLDILAGLAQISQSEGSQSLLANIQAKPAEGVKADDAFKASQLDLAVELLKQNVKAHQKENVMVSPMSVALALSMTANGAKGDTLKEMEQVLGGGISISELNDYYAGWLRSIEKEEEQKLFAADAIWVRDNENMIQVPEEFLHTCADYYGADAYKAPFDNSTVDDINAWCKTNTHDMIQKVLDYNDLDADSVMVLANALAFEALWSEQYEDYQVSKQDFVAADGGLRQVDMMHSTEHVYLQSKDAVGFLKWYRQCKYAFAAVLPENKSIDDYLASLDGKGLKALLDSKSYDYDVSAYLPKFKFDYGDSLAKMLCNMGMPTAFGYGETAADFTGLNSVPGAGTCIGDVIHKTFIDLSESGTKAAAVTAVIMKNESVAEPKEQVKVCLDRPFLFMILDMENGLPVFIGTVKDIGDRGTSVPEEKTEK